MKRILIISSFLVFAYSQDCFNDTWQDYIPNLDGCNLSSTDLSEYDFSYMSLVGVNFSNANLSNCNFTGANLQQADLTDAATWNTNFSDALMCGVDLSGLSNYNGVPFTEIDCFDVCGGTGELDECGVCDGDGSACFGCMDPFATNYSELAIYDDGSCEYYDGENNGETPPLIWKQGIYDNYNYPAMVNGLDNILLNYDPVNADYRNNNCVNALNNSVICKAMYSSYNGGSGYPNDINDGWDSNGDQYARYEIIIYKLDSNGELVWASEHGNWNDENSWVSHDSYLMDYSLGSIISNDGYYYLSGYTTYSNSSNSEYKGFILKINEDGQQEWVRFFEAPAGNSSTHYIRDIASSDSMVCAVGYKYNYNVSNDDSVIACYDFAGNQISIDLYGFNQEYYNTGNSRDDALTSIINLSNGDFVAFGFTHYYTSDNGNFEERPRIVRFNEEGIVFDKLVYHPLLLWTNLYTYNLDMVEMTNGDILIVSGNSSNNASMLIIDDDGEIVSFASDHNQFELGGTGYSNFNSVTLTNNNEILVTGSIADGFNGIELLLAKMDSDLNISWVKFYNSGTFGQYDYGNDVIQRSDNKIIVSGFMTETQHPEYAISVLAFEYEQGCTESLACNYNPIATLNDGSCYFEDACDVCDGNGYDFCDDDGDGVNNLEQWGYGAYNLEAVDAPDDQGGNLLFNFNKSFYDSDELQGRNESYTIELYQDSLWYVAQSFGAYGADTYNVIVPTLYDNQETTFRVIAHMDEGNFVSQEYATGMSIDNIAPAVPTILAGDFSDGSVNIAWSAPEDDDFAYFNIYRASQLYSSTVLSEFTDVDLPNIPEISYEVSAVDSNGNESALSDRLDIPLCLNGDMNEDYQLDVLDVILVMEHILDFYEYEPGECNTDLNMDGGLDILDVVMLVNIIVNGGAE